jgi:pentatricopeptide repeat protein
MRARTLNPGLRAGQRYAQTTLNCTALSRCRQLSLPSCLTNNAGRTSFVNILKRGFSNRISPVCEYINSVHNRPNPFFAYSGIEHTKRSVLQANIYSTFRYSTLNSSIGIVSNIRRRTYSDKTRLKQTNASADLQRNKSRTEDSNSVNKNHNHDSTPNIPTTTATTTTKTTTTEEESKEENNPLTKSDFLETFAEVERGTREVTPRLLINLLKACLRNRAELGTYINRVLNLQPRLTGGTRLDYSSLIGIFARMGQKKHAFAEYERARKSNVKLFENVWGLLAEMSGKHGHSEGAFAVLEMMKRDRDMIVGGKISTFIYHSLILITAKNNQLDEAFGVVHKMMAEGLNPNWVTYSCLVDACAMNGDLESGLHVLAQMRDSLRSPNKYQYQLAPNYFTTLLRACRREEDYDRLVEEMKKENIKPTQELLGLLIANTTGYHGGLPRALDMFNKLRSVEQRKQQNKPEVSDFVIITIRKPNFTSLLDNSI